MSVMESLKKALLKQREQEKDKPAASDGQFVNKGFKVKALDRNKMIGQF